MGVCICFCFEVGTHGHALALPTILASPGFADRAIGLDPRAVSGAHGAGGGWFAVARRVRTPDGDACRRYYGN